MTVVEKIVALRAAMEAERADGVYVPSSDPHMTEYLPARWRCRAWLSGFTGSAGTLCVTREAAALWTDGRYFIQAERQLEGSGITLMRMAQPGVPTAEEWLADRMPAGGTLALDGACTSVSVVESLEKALAEKRAVLRDHDFVSALWQEVGRPYLRQKHGCWSRRARDFPPGKSCISCGRGLPGRTQTPCWCAGWTVWHGY